MKMKIASVAALILVTLTVVGLSYALWSKTLYIFGRVHTGEIDAQIDYALAYWEAYDDAGNLLPPEKITFTVDWYQLDDPQEIYLDIIGLYPCIWIHIYFDLVNTGTVPWIIQDFIPNIADFPGTVTFSPDNLIGTQVEPDGIIPMDIIVHIDNTAAEDTSYGFSAEVFTVQWNEYVP
jgi:hypothetical protein